MAYWKDWSTQIQLNEGNFVDMPGDYFTPDEQRPPVSPTLPYNKPKPKFKKELGIQIGAQERLRTIDSITAKLADLSDADLIQINRFVSRMKT